MESNIGSLLVMLSIIMACLAVLIFSIYKVKTIRNKTNDHLDKIYEEISKL